MADTSFPSQTRKEVTKSRKSRQRPKICTAFTKASADSLFRVAHGLGWKIETTEREGCNIYWVATVEQLQARLRSLQAGQVVSRIAGMHYFSQKCGFTRLMTLGKRLFPSHFAFYPPSWNLPEDFASMQKELSGSTGALIVKPDDGAQGDGIFLATSFDNLMSHLRSVSLQTPMMVQRYLAQPLLLEGLKFDLRVYVFIASIEPLEVWVCREGLARFCTEKYCAPTSKNCHKVHGHLTNYSLNKRADTFVKCKQARPGRESEAGATGGDGDMECEGLGVEGAGSREGKDIGEGGERDDGVMFGEPDVVQIPLAGTASCTGWIACLEAEPCVLYAGSKLQHTCVRTTAL